MRIIKPTFNIVTPECRQQGIELLRTIERFARISHRAEDRQTDISWERFIKAVVLEHGDWSVVEHGYASVIFRVDRGVTHELVRHRLFSFTQESTRFVNGRKSYPDGLEFLCPREISPELVADSFKVAEEQYLRLLDKGVRPQEARSVLPNATAATIGVTGNLRNWRHFLIMRTTKETHPDFKHITIPLWYEFRGRVPLIFDDIVPESRQVEALRLPR